MTVNDYNYMRVPDDTEKNYFSMSLRFCRLTTIGLYNYNVFCKALLSRLLKSRIPAYSFKIHLILASQTSVTTLLRDALQDRSSHYQNCAIVIIIIVQRRIVNTFCCTKALSVNCTDMSVYHVL